MTLPFTQFVDRTGDGVFQKPDDDVSLHVIATFGRTASRGRERPRQNSPMQAGDFSASLYNLEGQYNDLEPGRLVQWVTSGGAGGSLGLEDGGDQLLEDSGSLLLEGRPSLVIATGVLDEPVEDPNFPIPTVTLPAKMNLATLRGKSISTGLYQNATTDVLLHALLDAAGWPADKRSIQVGLTTHSLWWLYKADAFKAAEDLQFSEGPGAIIYDSRDGWFVFENRDARTTQSRSTMPQATYATYDTANNRSIRIVRQKNFQDVIQACGITVEEREVQPLGEIWSWPSEIVLGPNEVWRRRFVTSDPFINALVPDSLAVNTIFTLTGSQPLTGGNFKLEYLGVRTSSLPYTLTASAAETALETLYGAGNVLCTGGPLNVAPIFCELVNEYATLNITTFPTVVESTLNPVSIPGGITVTKKQAAGSGFIEIQIFTPSGVLVSGTWGAEITFSFGTFQTANLPHNATANDIRDAFRAIFGLELTDCYFGPINTTEVEARFVDISSAPIDNVIIIQDPGDPLMMQTPGATVNIAVSQQGGVADYKVVTGTITQLQFFPGEGVQGTVEIIAGPTGLTLAPGLRVRGQNMPVVRTEEVIYPENTHELIEAGADIKIYRPPVLPSISRATALIIAMLYFLRYSVRRETIKVFVTNSIYSAEIDNEIQQEISNMIHAINPHLGIDGDFHIDKIRHSETADLKFISEYDCEKAA